jgi:hypothetical protein
MDIHAVLDKIRPGSAYRYGGDCINGYNSELLEWLDGGTQKPTDQEMDDGWVLVQADMAETEAISAVQDGAKAEIEDLPGWATWNCAQSTAWIDTNVTDLASAKLAIKKIACMLIALRNTLYPDLQNGE